MILPRRTWFVLEAREGRGRSKGGAREGRESSWEGEAESGACALARTHLWSVCLRDDDDVRSD
jgi:hypothetical protein